MTQMPYAQVVLLALTPKGKRVTVESLTAATRWPKDVVESNLRELHAREQLARDEATGEYHLPEKASA